MLTEDKADAIEAQSPTTTELEFHPAADIFPLMQGSEFDEFVADICAHGQQVPIVLHGGKILDGRNRYRGCLQEGIEPEMVDGTEMIDDPFAYVISANLRRRHLTDEEKRKAIAAYIAQAPEKSDRQFGKELGVDHKTVARARAEAEDVGKVPHVEKRTDTKGRAQPARRTGKKPAPKKPTQESTTAESMTTEPPYDAAAWAQARSDEELKATLRAIGKERLEKAFGVIPAPAYRDGIRGSDLLVTLTRLMRTALNELETARKDKDAVVAAAVKGMRDKLKAGGHDICDIQITIRGECECATKRAK
jgi:ParB-like chromosome segregation protein Spo0J